MAVLSFKVQADYEKVVKLREEIAKLETQLKSFGKNTPLVEIKAVETKLAEAKQEFTAVASEAARAGAVIDKDFKAKIRESVKGIDDLTAQILEQKAVIADHEFNVKKLGEAYRKALKNDSPKASSIKEELDAARRVVDEEKAALFGLTQEKAKAQLATKKLKDEYAEFKDEAKETAKESNNMGISLGKIAGLVGGITVLKQFGSAIVQVRGQFQEMETSIRTLVGDEMTSKLLPQIKELAKTSPLTMTDIVGAEKMMLGFNIEAEKTIDYLKAISDVSMGNSQKFNSLTLAFSQMSAAGKLMGQDLNQMINAGFNPLQQISKTTGKSIAQLKTEMSKGAISAQMVQQAFLDATAAGGKFYNMSENASKTINGQISMMQDAMDAMFNEIGTKSEGVIMKGIQTATSLIQNYEKIGQILSGLVVTFGAYKAAVIAVMVSEKAATLAKSGQTLATWALQKAQAALNKTMLLNPFVAFAAVITATTAAIVAYERNADAAKRRQKELNEAIEDSQEASTGELRGLAKLKGELAACEKGTDKYNEVKNKIVAGYGKYHEGLDKEIEEVGLLDETYKKLTESITASFSARQYDKFIKEQELSLDANLAKNYNKLYDRLTKELGDEKGSEVYSKIRDALMLGEELDADTLEILDKIQHKGKVSADSRIDNWIQNIREEMNAFQRVQQEAKIKFGIKEGEEEGKKTPEGGDGNKEEPNYGEAYAAAKAKYEADLKAFKEVEKNRSKFTVKEFEDRQKALKSSEEEFKKLGGKAEEKDKKSKENKAKEQKNTLNDDRKHEKERRRQLEDLENRLKQLQIDTEEDRTKAVQMQRKLDNEKEIQQLERQKEDYIDAFVQAEKERHEAQEAANKASNKDYLKQSFDENAAREAAKASEAYKKYDEIIRETREKQTQDQLYADELANLEYLAQYGDYLQRKENITKLYAAKITKVTTDGEKKALEAERDKLLRGLDQSLNAAYQNIFKDPTKMSLTTVKDAIKLAREEIKKITDKGVLNEDDLQNVKILQEAIDKLQDYLDNARFDNLGDGLDGVVQKFNQILALNKRIAEAQKTGNKEALEAAEQQKAAIVENLKENLIGLGIDTFTSSLSKAAAAVKEIADISGDANLAALGDTLERSANILTATAQGAASGGWIGAIVGFATSAVSSFVDLVVEAEEASARLSFSTSEFRRELELLGLTINESDYASVFGTQQLQMTQSALAVAKQAKNGFEEASNSIKHLSWKYGTGIAWFTSDALFETYDKIQHLSKEDIWDENGFLDVEKAEAFLATSQTITSEAREQVQHVIDLQKAYENAQKQIDDFLSTMVGSTASDLTDAIFEGVANGSDAWDIFDDKGQEVINNLGKQMLKEMIQNELSSAWTSKLEAAAGDPEEFAKTYAEMMEWLKERSEDYQRAAEGWNAQYGNIISDSEGAVTQQEATRKGYETLSEDTGNELVGRALAQYESNLRMEESMRMTKESVDLLTANQIQIKDIASESRALIADSYLELQQIRENTGAIIKPIKNLSDKIDAWDNKIMSL